MSTLNQVSLIGNLGDSPVIRSTNDGRRIANFSMATSERWKDKDSGTRQERTEWHRVVVFNEKLAEVVQKYLTKGKKVFVQGQLQTRKWKDQGGVDRYTTEVVVPRFGGIITLLSPADKREPGEETDDVNTSGPQNGKADTRTTLPDDNIPF